MSEPILFPPSTSFSPSQALDSAKLMDCTDVLIIGRAEDGDLVIRSSKMTTPEGLWLLEKAKQHLLETY